MSVYDSVFGSLCVEIITASPTLIISKLNIADVILHEITVVNEITLHVSVGRKDVKRLKEVAKKNGDSVKILKRSGIIWSFLRLRNRPILVAFALLVLSLTAFLPTRVLFMEIDGNCSLDAEKILSAANACGIGFGSETAEIRSEIFKNKMLQAIPKLQWLGVNTRGCVAYISVKERADDNNINKNEGNCIVAKKDGVVQSVTVTAGYPLCKKGDSIETGQLLVAGWIELEKFVRLEDAEGEIFADTEQLTTAMTPTNYTVKTEGTVFKKKFSILIGKKLINLFKGSGIYSTGCDRIYKKYTLTLPGSFKLPISVIAYSERQYKTETNVITESVAFHWLDTYVENYLLSQMSAGTILEATHQGVLLEDVYLLQTVCRCNEMIGMKCNKEFTEEYGKRD